MESMADIQKSVRTRHTVSGVIDESTPVHIFEHPVLGKYLERVDERAKPYVAELHTPREAVKAEEDPKTVALEAVKKKES